MRLRILSLSCFALVLASARGASPQEVEFFEKSVRPVLAEHCYKCHGPEKQKAALRLDSREAVMKGTEDGPVVVLGQPDQSSLIKSVRHQGDSKMPEKEDKLPDEQITALSEWVKMGAPWPENDSAHALTAQQAAAKTHWAFQPVKKPTLSADGDEIASFLRAKLAPAGLTLAAEAPKRTLLRRATFDLTGLPPTAAEVEAFEKDAAPDAFAKVVDRLLASPRYGERWGRYWLDVARYADTKGYLAGGEERRYGFAYTYRDWVIKALNDDLPYDQFLIQQIAADQVAAPGDTRPLAAMGFLTLGRRFLNSQPDIIDDRIDVVARGTMGLTVACARCHDHKFDPISAKDYYALYGVFASSIEPAELPLLPADTDPETNTKYLAERAKIQAEIDRFLADKCIELSAAIVAATRVPVLLPPLPRDAIKDALSRPDRDRSRDLQKKVDSLNAGALSPPRAMAMADGPIVNPHVFKRGNPGTPGDPVPRRFIDVLSGGNAQPFKNGSGRLELAQAIASKENPLTARVMVNRVWAYHFGKGIVRTPGDFGVRGDPPTHPELLDWLASRFVEDGWSLKKLHRTIMLSAAYRQGSDVDPKAAMADPENKLLSHMSRRRLDFEATRDSLLCVAGQLDASMGGRAVDIIAQPFSHRRTVYGLVDRQNLPGLFRSFDFASPDTTSPQRYVTTVPQQALFMMNSPFVIEQARSLVAPPPFKQPQAYEEQVHDLYARIFARRAETAEVDAGLRFVSSRLAPREKMDAVPVWQFGYGSWNEAERKVDFHPLPHFANGTWQGGPKVPDPTLGWVIVTALGGHPGGDAAHCAIRRWTAPRNATVAISGKLSRPSEVGNGVLGRIVSSRAGEVLKVEVAPQATAETAISVEVQAGDTLDFIVDSRDDPNSDSFAWAPLLRADGVEWDAQAQFSGPPPPSVPGMSAWEKYAQVLIETNEFVFVD